MVRGITHVRVRSTPFPPLISRDRRFLDRLTSRCQSRTILHRWILWLLGRHLSRGASIQRPQQERRIHVEGVNADLRHDIPTLARRSSCFPKKLENLQAVVAVFVGAYNRFAVAKYTYHCRHPSRAAPFSPYQFLELRSWTPPVFPGLDRSARAAYTTTCADAQRGADGSRLRSGERPGPSNLIRVMPA